MAYFLVAMAWHMADEGRNEESAFVKQRDETTPGNEWERISRLVDLSGKSGKCAKDTSRMRSILIQVRAC
jgi:hypothetical protein